MVLIFIAIMLLLLGSLSYFSKWGICFQRIQRKRGGKITRELLYAVRFNFKYQDAKLRFTLLLVFMGCQFQ